MDTKPLILPKKLLVAISGIGIAMIMGSFYNAYNGGEPKITWLLVGIACNFVAFFAVVIDVVRNPIKNRFTWILLLFLFSIISSFIYLIVRDNLIESKN